MYEIELLKFLKESRGASIYDVMKRFSIQRTAALYRIEKLSALHLISEFKDGKKNIYLPVEGAALETFFKDKIAELESGLKEITSTKAHGHHKSRDQRLTLSFVNYYDLSLIHIFAKG